MDNANTTRQGIDATPMARSDAQYRAWVRWYSWMPIRFIAKRCTRHPNWPLIEGGRAQSPASAQPEPGRVA